MKRMFLFSSMIFTSILFFAGCATKAQQTNIAESIPVKLVEAKHTTLSIPVRTSGLLASPKEMMLSFKTGGLIKTINVDEGSRVKQGQLLAELDPEEITAYKKQAESALDKASRDFKRVNKLYADSVVTLEQVQNSQTALDVARANFNIASFNEKHASIYAPSSGRILKRLAENGEITAAGKPVLIFGSINGNWILKVSLSDKDMVRIQLDDSAKVVFDAYPGKSVNARVNQIAAGAAPESGTFEIELLLKSTDLNLFSGLVAQATIYPSKAEKVVLVPTGSVTELSGMLGTVYTIRKDFTAQKHTTEIAFVLDDQIAFKETPVIPDSVVSDGLAYLTDGDQVEIKR